MNDFLFDYPTISYKGHMGSRNSQPPNDEWSNGGKRLLHDLVPLPTDKEQAYILHHENNGGAETPLNGLIMIHANEIIQKIMPHPG